MAGDWIKMRTDLGTSPKVVRLASALKADRLRIIGGLHSAWSIFDAHSEDGILVGYTFDVLDDLIGWPGFAAAMSAVGWLDRDGETLALPRFDAHNGLSAKRRAQDADRKRVRRMSASEADARPENVRPRGEESRVEIKAKATVHPADAPPVPDGLPADIEAPEPPAAERASRAKPKTANRFPEWWAAYPVKKGKAAALKTWKAKDLDGQADALIAHCRRMEREDDQWKRGFIPHGSTYLNGERWTDEPMREGQVGSPAPSMPQGAKAAMAPSETKLQHAISWAQQQYQRGDFGQGEEALEKLRAEVDAARRKYAEE